MIARGTSMGGLVTGRLAQTAGERIDGVLCYPRIMAGAVDLHNYQLDGLHALNELPLPSRQIKLVGFASFDEVVVPRRKAARLAVVDPDPQEEQHANRLLARTAAPADEQTGVAV